MLLVKKQKWLSEFCVKIHRVSSKNYGRSGDRKHTYLFWGLMVYQRQGQRSIQNYLQRKEINNGIPTPRPTITQNYLQRKKYK